MSPPEVNPHAPLRYLLTLLFRCDSHPVISHNIYLGPLRIADLVGPIDDKVDPSWVPSQTPIMMRLLPVIPRARNDTTHDTVDPMNAGRVGSNYGPRHAW